MNAIPTVSGDDRDLQKPSASEASGRASDAATGSVWFLEPSRIGHLPACLRALGVSAGQEGRRD